jgi:hypothetical protein
MGWMGLWQFDFGTVGFSRVPCAWHSEMGRGRISSSCASVRELTRGTNVF